MLCLSLVLALGLTAALVPTLVFGLVLALADSGTGFCISSDSVPSSGSDSVSGNKIALTWMTEIACWPNRLTQMLTGGGSTSSGSFLSFGRALALLWF